MLTPVPPINFSSSERTPLLATVMLGFMAVIEPLFPSTPTVTSTQPVSRSRPQMSLAELELSVRATNCLESEGITSVRDLVSRSEDQLLTVRNFGETTLKEVKAKLHEIGLVIGMDVPPRGGA